MERFEFRHPIPGDHKELLQILYDTGYYGETLKGRGLYEDKVLWGYFWLDYYLENENEYCFVAWDREKRKVAGYILGSPDTQRYQDRFMPSMRPRIRRRLALHTWWRHPQTFRRTLQFRSIIAHRTFKPGDLQYEYPGHLHMNVALDYQGHGLGTQLIHKLEDKLREKGIRGIHLGTTSKNLKAVPFYKKNGYEIVFTGESTWMGIMKQKSEFYMMAKEL